MTATPPAGIDFLVQRHDLLECKSIPLAVPTDVDLFPGQVLLKVDKFAFTANNVTYAAFGDKMSYWNFFPAADGWGRIPVWGFGDVLLSKHGGIKVGERFYGYFPMSTHLVAQADHVTEAGFSDVVPHRLAMHAVYNQYMRTSTDPAYSTTSEDEQVLLRPLFMTSFLIDDFLAQHDFFDAKTVIISSASSKTAYGLAFLLAMRGHTECEVIGLTAAGNVDFVKGLDCYEQVLPYEEVTSLSSEKTVVYVDMSGNVNLRRTLHHHFQANMKYSCAVGGTHWNELGGVADLPGPEPILFFAPSQAKKRSKDWGLNGMQERVAAAWLKFMASVLDPNKGWLQVVHGAGPKAVELVYLEMLNGRAKPNQGQVLSLWWRNLDTHLC